MEIHEQSQGAVRILKPTGPLVDADATLMKTAALKAAAACLGRVLVDASAIAFVDSLGIEALADVSEQLGRSGRSLKLCGANPTIRQVLDLTGWSASFEFYEDVTAGMRSFL